MSKAASIMIVLSVIFGALLYIDAAPAAVSQGSSWVWGGSAVGDGTRQGRPVPRLTRGLTDVVKVAGGEGFTLALRPDGSLWGWGYNGFYDLANPRAPYITTPESVGGLSDVIDMVGGGDHGLAVKSDGSLWSWGANNHGQLGTGDNTYLLQPFHIPMAATLRAVSAGRLHSLALDNNGNVWAWGFNAYGQIGDGTTVDRLSPVQVPISNVVSISTRWDHNLALKSDGTVWSWGKNFGGGLGDGTTTNRLTPVQVLGLRPLKAISAGGHHSKAIAVDGTVWSWGYNQYGQVGDGTTIDRLIPVQLPSLTGIQQLSAGIDHTLALRADGTILSWGRNEGGQIGDGTATDRHSPTPVFQLYGPPEATFIAAGGYHSMAIGPGWDYRDHVDQGLDPVVDLQVKGKQSTTDPTAYELSVTANGQPVYTATLAGAGAVPPISSGISNPTHISVTTISNPYRVYCAFYDGNKCTQPFAPIVPLDSADWLQAEGQACELIVFIQHTHGSVTVRIPYVGQTMAMVPELET